MREVHHGHDAYPHTTGCVSTKDIQINFWGSLLSTTEVLHTCKIVNYFYLPIYFWQGGPQLSGNGLQKVNYGWGQIRWGQRDGARGWGKGGNRGGMYILIKFSVKQLER